MSRFGWRWWDTAPDGSLQSVNRDLWPPNDPMEAICLPAARNDPHPDEKPPAFDCRCGIWAFWDPEIASGLPYAESYFRNCKVFGVIEAWGDLVEHDYGFRAEFAIVRAVCVLRGRLHAAYEVPRYPNIDKMLQTWDVNDDHR